MVASETTTRARVRRSPADASLSVVDRRWFIGRRLYHSCFGYLGPRFDSASLAGWRGGSREPSKTQDRHVTLRALTPLVLVVATTGVAAAQGEAGQEPKEAKTEVGAVPLLGGDSDIGFGGGMLGAVTRLEPGRSPYLWNADVGGLLTVKPPNGEHWRVPYQDYYIQLTVPEFFHPNLRLEVRPSYTKETTQSYYGIGNASPAPETGPQGQSQTDYFQYGRIHPTLLIRIRLALGGRFSFLFGNAITYNRLDIHPGSKLEQDLGGTVSPHLVHFFEHALLYDRRDSETSTHDGMFHQLKLRLSPGGTSTFPYQYGQVDGIARFYVTPIPKWLTIALRLVGDVQFGNPPFYELARFEDTFALGGGKGVRGVPGQRYYGRIKVFGNLETRTDLATFHLGPKPCLLGAALFFDAGRLWSDWKPDPQLDGSGLGLKYGVGAGLRLQQGEAFVVRGDVAWSPDARPIGAYFTAGQTF